LSRSPSSQISLSNRQLKYPLFAGGKTLENDHFLPLVVEGNFSQLPYLWSRSAFFLGGKAAGTPQSPPSPVWQPPQNSPLLFLGGPSNLFISGITRSSRLHVYGCSDCVCLYQYLSDASNVFRPFTYALCLIFCRLFYM